MVVRTNIYRRGGFFILILTIVFFSIFPFVQMVSTSLKYPWDWGNPSLIPDRFNFDAYKELLNIDQQTKDLPEAIVNLLEESPELTRAQRDAIIAQYRDTSDAFPFFRYFLNSTILSFTAALLSVCFAVPGAYSFSRLRYRGRSSIQRSVLFVYMFGGIVLVIPLYKMFVGFGMLSSPVSAFLSLIIVYMVKTLPVSLYMLGNYFRAIPFSIEEAAMIEGASRLEAIWKIIVPLSWTAITTVFVYSFMIAWNEYLFASVFLRGFKEFHTLSIGLKSLVFSKNAIWDRIMAASVLTAIPVIVIFMNIQKNLVGGLSEGGVKE